MSLYVIINRRADKFTSEAKLASRAALVSTLGMIASANILADHDPADALARRVVLLEADDNEIAP